MGLSSHHFGDIGAATTWEHASFTAVTAREGKKSALALRRHFQLALWTFWRGGRRRESRFILVLLPPHLTLHAFIIPTPARTHARTPTQNYSLKNIRRHNDCRKDAGLLHGELWRELRCSRGPRLREVPGLSPRDQ